MKYLLLLAGLFPVVLHAQVTHSVGVGTYINYSKPVNLDETLDTITGVSQDVLGSVNVSPFIEYTIGVNRFHASAGVGLWHSGSSSSYQISLGFFPITFDTKTKERSVFFPVSIGYDIIKANNFSAGIEAKANFRYLTRVYGEVSSTFGTFSNTASGSDLDTLDLTRFYVAPGASIYAAYEIGRFTPSLELGALYELQGATTLNPDKNKYLNLFAALTLRYRFCGTEEDGATR